MEPTPDTIVIGIILALFFILLCAFLCRPSEAERKETKADSEDAFNADLNALIIFLNQQCKYHNQRIDSFLKKGEKNIFELDLYNDILSKYRLFEKSPEFREALWRRAGFSFIRNGRSIYVTKGPLPDENEKYNDRFYC